MKIYRDFQMQRCPDTNLVQVRAPSKAVVHLAKNIRAAHQWIWRATKPKPKGTSHE